jgi:hypothetical protein
MSVMDPGRHHFPLSKGGFSRARRYIFSSISNAGGILQTKVPFRFERLTVTNTRRGVLLLPRGPQCRCQTAVENPRPNAA